MTRTIRLATFLIVSTLSSLTVGVLAQSGRDFHKPLPPVGPTSEDQCRALEADWSATCKQISDAHQQCLDSYQNSDVKGAGECSRAPCLALHQQMTSCGGEERRRMVDACYAQVRDHQAREAQFQQMQQEAIRAQQQAERERLQRLEAEAAKASLEAKDARRRAEAYRRNTSDVAPRRTLDDQQNGFVDGLRDRADAATSGLQSTIARVGRARDETDFSRIEASARDVLAHEGRDVLMAGLAHSETLDFIPQTYEVFERADGVADALGQLWDGARYFIDKLAGATTSTRDLNAFLDGIELVSAKVAAVPLLRLETISQVGNVVSGLRNSQSYAMGQLEAMTNAFVSGGSYTLSDTFDQDYLRALLSPIIPFGPIERLQHLTDDASYTWESGKSAVYRLFHP